MGQKMEGSKLDRLIPKAAYRERGRTHIFPSQSSLDWFIRSNRSALISGEALVIVGRRGSLVDPIAFDEVVQRVLFNRPTEPSKAGSSDLASELASEDST
jgi:hypothetical protein